MDPRILVVTLEIVDMHEAFQRQKAEQARERAQKYVPGSVDRDFAVL